MSKPIWHKPAYCFASRATKSSSSSRLQHANRLLVLGTRQHNFLLLTLARARLADAESNASPKRTAVGCTRSNSVKGCS